jgi:serine/threonine-protein kinase
MKIEKLGPYRIERQIGKGGMGAVYAAVYEGAGSGAGTRVAIKALSPQLAMEEGFRERFEAEIESLKQLRHEGIVRLYGYGEQDGILFYSMELVEGTSLEEEIHKGRRFNWQETLAIGTQVCRALKHAHDHGVIHRDIKPANLMLTKDNRIKIADFGIARLFGGSQLTTAGGVLGTADYMSPEQADGRPITEKCDQYSLGGVMYALLAGRPPFRAKTMPEMLQMQRFAEPEPVRRYAPETPEQLDRLIQQLLAKEPENRFPNVLVLGRHMEAMEKALSRTAPSGESEELELEWPQPEDPNVTLQLGKDATDAGQRQVRLVPKHTAPQQPDIYEAATIAQPDIPAISPGGSTLAASTPAPARQKETRFTTVDEEARRRQREEEEESHLALIGRWVALFVLLGGMSWGAWKLFRPATADELYGRITSTIEREGDEDLRLVEAELTQFMKRFPDDPRKDELTTYVSQLEFQRLQRKARTRSRVSGAKSVGPIEQLYLTALGMVETEPAKAAATLGSLIDLYDPLGVTVDGQVATGNDRSALTADDRRWLVLARKEFKKLNDQASVDAKQELPTIEERLAAAKVVARARPEQAKKMYEAIIRLYGDAPWAVEAVKKAQGALDALEETEKP